MEAFGTPPWLFTRLCGDRVAAATLVLFRLSLFVVWAAVVLWSATDKLGTYYGDQWGIYLTNWSSVWLLIYLFFASLTTCLAVAKKQPCSGCTTTPWYAHIAWLMHMTAVVFPILVTVCYGYMTGPDDGPYSCPNNDPPSGGFPEGVVGTDNTNNDADPPNTPDKTDDCGLRYDYLKDQYDSESFVAPYKIPADLHGWIMLVALLDWCVHKHWYPIWDMAFPLSFGATYIVFTLMYQQRTELVIYPKINWRDGDEDTAVGVALVIILTIVPLIYAVLALCDLLFKQWKWLEVLRSIRDFFWRLWTSPCCPPPEDLERGEPIDVECQTDGNPLVDPTKSTLSRQDIREAFELFDKDGSGALSLAELQDALAKLEVDGDARPVLKRFDADGDGTLGLEEFEELVVELVRLRHDDADDRGSMRKSRASEAARLSSSGSPRRAARASRWSHASRTSRTSRNSLRRNSRARVSGVDTAALLSDAEANV